MVAQIQLPIGVGHHPLAVEDFSVHKRSYLKLGFALPFVLTLSGPVLAASSSNLQSSDPTDWKTLAIAFTFFLPVGLILLSTAAFPEERTVSAATGGLVTWGLATLAYFAVGFAFQFGGIALFLDNPALAGLYWEYSLLDTTWGTGWGMIGLKGFLLLDDASTAGALTLFLSQLPLLGVAALIPCFAIHDRAPRWVALLASLLMGSLIYPIVGNWTWGGGWLANLGSNLGMGHGLVDAGGSGQAVLVGAGAAVAALLVFGDKSASEGPHANQAPGTDPQVSDEDKLAPNESEMVPMPPVHLPLLGLLGASLMLIGWLGTVFLAHLPTALNTVPAVMAANLVLGALGGALTAGLYSWFTTSDLNPLMSARGLVAGLVVVAAGAPFIPPWSALAAGLVIGLILPSLIYLFDRVLRMDDAASSMAIFGLPALLGLLLLALEANGGYGVGWNGVGEASYLGVDGQGVSGLLVKPSYASDWPGQMQAQLIGAVAIFAWSFGLSWLLMQILAGIIHAWERSGLEFGAPPEPVDVNDEIPAIQDGAPTEEAEAPFVRDETWPSDEVTGL
jgi:Amt family ammonium transporter